MCTQTSLKDKSFRPRVKFFHPVKIGDNEIIRRNSNQKFSHLCCKILSLELILMYKGDLHVKMGEDVLFDDCTDLIGRFIIKDLP
jgi:hypothetical protein